MTPPLHGGPYLRRGAARAALAGLLPLISASGPAAAPDPVVFAVGTSTYDTGLLDALVPPFEAATGIRVKVVPVGTGQALALAGKGEADLVLTHDPQAEERLMDRGAGILRRRMMSNDFVLVGPQADPAGARRARSASEALAAVARAGATFVSRGDDSGTHAFERRLWAEAGLAPRVGETYLETGQGQAATLRVASQKRGYALTDRGTFLSQRDSLDLAVLFEGGAALRNTYHLIVASPRNGPRVNVEGARALARYLLSRRSQDRVREFGRERFGRPLFEPDAEPLD